MLFIRLKLQQIAASYFFNQYPGRVSLHGQSLPLKEKPLSRLPQADTAASYFFNQYPIRLSILISGIPILVRSCALALYALKRNYEPINYLLTDY
jgi:hypothetical protein